MGQGNAKLLMAVAAGMAMAGGGQIAVRAQEEVSPPMFAPGVGRSRGKGGKKSPRHSSRRFVAMDKRDARSVRNRNR